MACVDDDRAGGHAARDGDGPGELADIGEGHGAGTGIAELVIAIGVVVQVEGRRGIGERIVSGGQRDAVSGDVQPLVVGAVPMR